MMRRTKLCVLGGSSPFTAGLIDSFAKARHPSDLHLVIHGRSAERASLVAHYAEVWLRPLGWTVAHSTSLAEAVDGADIVIHQIRYGDLEGRALGEGVCQALQLPPDETIGPGALLTAIRSLSALNETCNVLQTHCPNAQVLNLTNPLSAMTAAMRNYGVRNCIGLCELPWVTLLEAARLISVDPEDVSWTYCGLNHRGFIDSFELHGEDLLPQLPSKLGSGGLGEIEASEIRALHAIPLKYFRLVRETPTPRFGRAAQLAKLRRQIAQELTESCERSPPSLQRRYMDWYPMSVVPLVSALTHDGESDHIVNVQHGDLIVETNAAVSRHGITPKLHSTRNAAVERWNRVFEIHERNFLRAMVEPTLHHLLAVLESDPMVPASKANDVVMALRKHLPQAGQQTSSRLL